MSGPELNIDLPEVELVRTETQDGVRLDGAYHAPVSDSTTAVVDSVILVHGVGGNFYGSNLMNRIALECASHGLRTLRVNTRGHDGVHTAATRQGGRRIGAAFEIVDDCRHDLNAWTHWLVGRGARHVGLVGHSLGALKILYAEAWAPHPAVRRLCAISPPRLSYQRFVSSSAQQSFLASYQEATQWVSASRPEMLFQASFPFPLVLSARTFVDKYGPDERYNLLRFVDRVARPTTIVFGESELSSDQPAFHRLREELEPVTLAGDSRLEVSVIPGANHFYAKCLDSLVARVLDALRSS